MIRSAATTGRPAASASAKPQASRTTQPAAKPKAAPSATRAGTAAAKPASTAHSTVRPATAAPTAAATTLSCNLSDGLLPDNVTAIVTFLLAHGYSDNAAAGIAGNMYQESKGNPESEGMGGGGLIGFTPLPDGYVTGNPAADLQTQLEAVLTYNQQWASLPAGAERRRQPGRRRVRLRHRLRAGRHPRRQHPRGLGRGRRQRLRHLGAQYPGGPAVRQAQPSSRSCSRPTAGQPPQGSGRLICTWRLCSRRTIFKYRFRAATDQRAITS